jgi:hypothetical protein
MLGPDDAFAILTKFFRQYFKGDIPAESRVASPVYNAHSSRPDYCEYFVLLDHAADPGLAVIGSHNASLSMRTTYRHY